MATGTSIAIDDLGYTHSTPQHAEGQTVELNGNTYRYIYNASATTAISQYYVAYLNTAVVGDWNCLWETGLAQRLAVGVAYTAIGTQEYGWVCKEGLITAYISAQCTTVGFPLRAVGAGGLTPSLGTDAGDNLDAQGAVLARAVVTIGTVAATAIVDVCGAI